MKSFVQFILILLGAGSAVAVGIVFAADAHNGSRRAADIAREQQRFNQVIERFNGVQRHAVIAVEWQKIDATQQVLESSLLVRLYTLDAEEKEVPLPIQRLLIPQNRVVIEGLSLNFDPSFLEEYKEVRGATLLYFHYIHGDTQPREEGLTLLRPNQPPRTTQMYPDHVTQYELQLWQHLWDLMNGPKEFRHGLTVLPESKDWITPPARNQKPVPVPARFTAARTLTNGNAYSVYFSTDGITVSEDNDPSILMDMRREAAILPADDGSNKPFPN